MRRVLLAKTELEIRRVKDDVAWKERLTEFIGKAGIL